MCGFNGYFNLPLNQSKAKNLLEGMNERISHRGPDGEGFWQGESVGLAHRRLSIIDLEGGKQPMESSDGRFVIVFNGEIYNYQQLRKSLQAVGYKFQTNSDTEVIPYVLDHYGIEVGLNQLRGMFAFACYDKKKHNIILARDYVGIKPVYFAGDSTKGFLFGSEIKSLIASNYLEKQLNLDSILDFLITGHTFAPNTIWASINELAPGNWAEINSTGISIHSYWSWQFEVKNQKQALALDNLEVALKDSIEHHLISDVKIASFLSGGVDSSLISAIACKNYAPDLMTFNVGFTEKKYDESPYARMVAKQYRSDHHEVIVEDKEGHPDLFEKIILQYDQPFGDSSCLPTYLICNEISQHVKVVLSGDGGDELFGGYARYKTINTLNQVNKIPLSRTLLKLAGHLISPMSEDKSRQLKKASLLLSEHPKDMIVKLLSYFNQNQFRKILTPDLYAYSEKDFACSLYNFIPEDSSHLSEQFIATEINALLHADYLRKVDIASMAHGLEVRTPFLDKELFKFSAQLPLSLKINNGESKYLLKKLGEKYLPKSLIYRPKQGFGIPFDKWADNKAMNNFIKDVLLSPSTKCKHFIQQNHIQQLLDSFSKPNARVNKISRYQVYQQVFMLLSLELFLNRWQPIL